MCDKNKKSNVVQTMEMVESKFTTLIDTIALFNEDEAIIPINREQLKEFPFFEWKEINDKVKVFRKRDRFKEGYLCFDTIMEPKGAFGEHFHSDLIESTEVVYGVMYDSYDGKYYRKGDVVHYEKGQKHTPIAKEKTRLHVLFKP